MPKTEQLIEALNHPLWVSHQIGDEYTMDGKPGWKIAYYPIFEDGKTGTLYDEPRALVEKSIAGGIDFREVPLRYLTKLPDNLLVQINQHRGIAVRHEPIPIIPLHGDF